MSTQWNNRYSQPDSWYEEDYIPEKICRTCEENEQKIDCAKEILETLVQMLYSKGSLNLNKFEENLDELCHLFQVKLLPGDLQIERTKEIRPFYHEWISLAQ
jgi:hypothetical protein